MLLAALYYLLLTARVASGIVDTAMDNILSHVKRASLGNVDIGIAQLDDDLMLSQVVGQVTTIRGHHHPFLTGFRQEPSCRQDDLMNEVSDEVILEPRPVTRSYFGRCIWLSPYTSENEHALLAAQPPYDSRVFLVSGANILEMWEVYTVNKVTQVKKVMKDQHIWDRRRDLMGTRFRLGYVKSKMYAEKDEDGRMFGKHIDMLHALAYAMNFTYDLAAPQDGQYGSLSDNGSWTGLVGMLYKGEVEVGVSVLSASKERTEAVAFSVGVDSTAHHAWILPRDRNTYPSATVLVSMLDPSVWIVTWVTIATAVLLGAFYGSRGGPAAEGSGGASIGLSTLGHILNQGSAETWERLSTRILALTCLLLGIVVFNIFSARLASTLSVPMTKKTIRKLEDLLDQDYDVFVPAGTSHMNFLKNGNRGSPERNLWERKVSKLPESHTLAVDSLEEPFMRHPGGAAILAWPVPRWILKNPEVGCHLYSIDLGLKEDGAYPVVKNWSYVEALNFNIMKAKERGIFEGIASRWMPPHQEDTCKRNGFGGEAVFRPVSMDSIWQFFALLLSGLLLAAIIGTLEKINLRNGLF